MTKYKGLGEVIEKTVIDKAVPVAHNTESDVRYPEQTFNSLQVKGLKGLTTDDEVEITIKATVVATGKGERDYNSDPDSDVQWARFCLKSAVIEDRDEVEDELEKERSYRKKPMSEL